MGESSKVIGQNAAMIGIIAGPICGLRYQTPSASGVTNERGEFSFSAGDTVTFLVGGLVLGTADAALRVNLAQLVNRVAGNIDKLHDPAVTNLARLVISLDQAGIIEGGITIVPSVHDAVLHMPINYGQPEEAFGRDPMIVRLLTRLDATPGAFAANTPRALIDGAVARNELRRNIRGIIKHTDVRIPLRDGSYLCADVFRPAESGQHPVIMSQGVYGKAFYHECICNDEQAMEKERLEDRFFPAIPMPCNMRIMRPSIRRFGFPKAMSASG